MSILINDGGSLEEEGHCDIGKLVVLVQVLKVRLERFSSLVDYVKSVLQWHRPVTSLSWMTFLLLALYINPAYLVVGVLLPIPPYLVLALFYSAGKRKTPNKRYQDYFQHKNDTQMVELKRQMERKEHLNLYYEILIAAQRVLEDINSFLDYVQSMAQWRRPFQSALLLLFTLTIEFGTYLLEGRYVLMFCVVCLFMPNKYFYKAVTQGFGRKVGPSKVKPVYTETHAEKNTAVEDIPLCREEFDSTTDDSEVDEDEEEGGQTEQKEEMVKREYKKGGSVMSKLFSRRRVTGECTNCEQACSSILNKRRYCRHCGNSFCGKCCYKSVPRSFLGATAPAAHQGKVLVCMACHVFLTNRFNSTPAEM